MPLTALPAVEVVTPRRQPRDRPGSGVFGVVKFHSLRGNPFHLCIPMEIDLIGFDSFHEEILTGRTKVAGHFIQRFNDRDLLAHFGQEFRDFHAGGTATDHHYLLPNLGRIV